MRILSLSRQEKLPHVKISHRLYIWKDVIVMEALAWLGVLFVLGVGATVFFAIRSHVLKERKEREEQARKEKEAEEAFLRERFAPFYRERIKPLPVTEITYTYWWYQRLGWFGPWQRFEKKKTFFPSENQILNAAYYYLKAVEAGDVRERNFTDQSELWLFVHENVKALFTINYY